MNIALMDIRREVLKKGEITWCWCSRCHDRTPHLWTGSRLICLECHPELDPEKDIDSIDSKDKHNGT